MKRVGIYLRVSTDSQTTDNQRIELEAVAARSGWQVIGIYEDAGISGAKGRDKRPGLDRLIKDGLHTRAVTIRDTLIEGFSHFVTSMTAPIASGWSGCRVGLAPTGKRRLGTAHTRNGHFILLE